MRSQYTVLSLCVLRFYSLSTDRREFRALTPPGGTGTGYSDVKPGSGRDRGGHSVLAQRPCWMHHVHKSMQLFGTSVLCLSAWCYWIAAPFSGNALRQAGMRSTKRHGPPQRFRPCRLLGAHSGGNHAFWGPPRNPRPRCLSRSLSRRHQHRRRTLLRPSARSSCSVSGVPPAARPGLGVWPLPWWWRITLSCAEYVSTIIYDHGTPTLAGSRHPGAQVAPIIAFGWHPCLMVPHGVHRCCAAAGTAGTAPGPPARSLL